MKKQNKTVNYENTEQPDIQVEETKHGDREVTQELEAEITWRTLCALAWVKGRMLIDADDPHTIFAILLIGICPSGSNLPSLPRETKIWQHIGSC